MSERKRLQQTRLSQAHTPEEIGAFWDTHSVADYWAETHAVVCDVRVQRRRRITLDPAVYTQIEMQAHARGLMPETLVNLWLQEHLQAHEKA